MFIDKFPEAFICNIDTHLFVRVFYVKEENLENEKGLAYD